MKTGQKISTRQMVALLFAGMLSPTIRALPRRSTSLGGEAGWLSCLIAAVPLLLVIWCVMGCLKRMPAGSGMGELFERALGHRLGRILSGMYALWMMLVMAVFLRLYAERFLSTTYQTGELYLFLSVMVAMMLWMSEGSFGAFARMGEIFCFLLVAALALALGLAAGNVKLEHVLPLWWEDTPDALLVALPALGTLGYGVTAFFLAGQVKDAREGRGKVVKWSAAFCLMLTCMQFIVVGLFGPTLTAQMEVPFFMTAKEVNIAGGVERIESVIVTLWVLTDLVLLGLFVRSACAAIQHCFHLEDGQKVASPMIMCLLPIALLVASTSFELEQFNTKVVTGMNLILAYLVPLFVCAMARLRKRL